VDVQDEPFFGGGLLSLANGVEQRLRLSQIGGVETLSEPAIDRREQVAGFGVTSLVAA
jgi:hypothetical protein